MKAWKKFSLMATVAAVALSACATDPMTGQVDRNNTVLGALGGAATCGIVGALTHGSKGARNSALACGAIGAGVGAYMDHQERQLRQSLANTQVEVNRVGDEIRLVMPESITFATGSYQLNSSASSSLNSVSSVLAQYTDTTINIVGHTDSTGSDAINEPLSRNRASAVANYLVSRNVASNRITTAGAGSRQPVASNNTVAGRAENRRVEITVNPIQR
ncbi:MULTISPECIES: OmpA family protein [Vitreoscilla]|uniref:OmpA family protein n=1 Tax=Vitreoscilla stercoraria TaxID=61 RepID=A0ABY4EB40_VITST|nr:MULTISPECIES: OmpA family protein [Vitreoscilla]AUZ05962.1 outer membrane protein OmpA/MotB [Vitreoscilla sp. C1]UOO92672.1 OmpA family protein [Vitreoscilla stercoraria]